MESRARLMPEIGAAWIEVGGAYAMFDGVESPCTQTFGLGMFDKITNAELNTIESFFKSHDAPVFHEISPLADISLMPLLNDCGYRPIELTSVMYRELALNVSPARSAKPSLVTRIIEEDEVDVWARTSAAGWATEMGGLAEFMFQFGRISARCAGSYPYLAELDGKPIAAGMLFIYDGVALLAGASTIPDGRNNGAQNALLDARLRFATERGCGVAAMAALPGSQSQRNAEKNGFRIAYTRTKWHLNQ